MNKKKRGLALLLALVMVMTTCLSAAATWAQSGSGQNGYILDAVEVNEIPGFDNVSNMAEANEDLVCEAYEDGDLVTVIVEFEEAPVLDYFGTSTYAIGDENASAGEAVSEFLATEDAQALSEELISGQDAVIEEINELGTEDVERTADVEVVAQWTYTTNAMAVRVPYGVLKDIKKLDGVKRAYVQHVYDHPETQPNSVDLSNPNYSFSLDMIGLDSVWDSGYTGKGMLVAILDSGIDVIQDRTNGMVLGSHEVFTSDSFKSGNPEDGENDWTLRYNETTMTQFLAEEGLYANTSVTTGDHITYDNNALYKNLKVPFGFDYADWDPQTRPTTSDHGTHVAGTVAGYHETEEGVVTFSGVAPDAQIMAMKVFPDEAGGAEEISIVCALEDSVVLGADIINLSLGSDNGYGEDDTMQNDVFARVEAAGIVMMTSAGNSAYSSENNNYDGESAIENPENSMISSPAVYPSNLSVASIDNTVDCKSYLSYSIDGAAAVDAFFTDTTGKMKALYSGQEYPVYLVDGYGTWQDFYNAGFDNGYNGGKTGIALVKRGELAFTEKLNNASSFRGMNSRGEVYGVVACIIYDADPNSESLITMGVDGASVDSCFISGKSGAAMEEALRAGKSVTVRASAIDKTVENATAYQVSSYSSWGTGPNLELKPEIAAPGGNVWSSVIDRTQETEGYVGKYEMMSGTSMAAPHMSGVGALVRQRVNTESEFNGIAALEVGDVVSQLLVSTATPLKDPNGVYYSPRAQGAGLVSADGAIKTPVYISVEGKNVGKLELGDDINFTGSYDIEFDLHNVSNSDVTYEVSVVLLRPDTDTVTSEWGERDVMLASDVEIKTVNLGTITAAAEDVTHYSENVSLSSAEITELKNLFPNGTYVEGYVILKDTNDVQPQLGLPMLSFFGDWTKAPIFDNTTWLDAEDGVSFHNNENTWTSSIIGSAIVATNGQVVGYYNLGENAYNNTTEEQTIYHPENIEISPNGDGIYDAIDDIILYQLRNARLIVFEARDAETNELYYHDWAPYVTKTVYSYDYGIPFPMSLYYSISWDGKDLEGNKLPSGTKCIYTITAFGDGDYSAAGTVVDDYYGMEVTNFDQIIPGELEPTFGGHAMDKTGDQISFPVVIDTEAPKLDNNAVTVYEEDGHTYIKGTVYDVDGSLACIRVLPLVERSYKEGYGDPSYSEWGLDYLNPFYENIVYDAEKKTLEFEADVTEYARINESYPGESYYFDYTWGGNVVVSIGDYGGNSRSYAIAVDATEGIVLSQTSALLQPGDTFELSANNNTEDGGDIVRTSSNPEVATIDEYGHITAVAPGQTIITVSNDKDSAICVVAVEEKPTEVIDFNLSIERVDGLKPEGQATVKVVDLYPADVVIDEIRWEVSEDDDYAADWGEGFISVEKNSADALSGSLYLTALGANDGTEIPGGGGTLTVTINGVSRSMRVTWDDFYTSTSQDGLISDELYQEQVIYTTVGEAAEFTAKYRQASLHSISDVDARLTGLKLDGPEFYYTGAPYTAILVNEADYKLPSTIRVWSVYTGYDGTEYLTEYTRDAYYNGFTYNETTGEINIPYTPYGTSTLRIEAVGEAEPGNPAGTMSGTTYTTPDSIYGPFDWELLDGEGDLGTIEVTDYYGNTYEKAQYTPSEPGVSYIKAQSRNTGDGSDPMDIVFTVVCLPTKADTITLDTHKLTVDVGRTGSVTATLSPDPTFASDEELIWKSFNEDVATVDENGVITGVSEGQVFFTVRSKANTNVMSYVVANVVDNRHIVKFVDYDGTVLKEERVVDGNAAVAPIAPTREGYTFIGWDVAFDNVTSDLVVTAQYNINQYTVTFMADGKVVGTVTKNYGDVLTDADYPEVPAKEGYTGVWEKYGFAVTGNITLYAKYEAKSVGGGNTGTGNVDTGDNSSSVLWNIVLLLAAGCGTAVCVIKKRR